MIKCLFIINITVHAKYKHYYPHTILNGVLIVPLVKVIPATNAQVHHALGALHFRRNHWVHGVLGA